MCGGGGGRRKVGHAPILCRAVEDCVVGLVLPGPLSGWELSYHFVFFYISTNM